MRDIHGVIYREGVHWVAQAINVEVSSFGDTPQEAKSALREALELYFEEDGEIEVHEAAEPRLECLRV